MFLHALRPVRGGCVSAETQTDLLIVERGQPVVNFLDSAECPFDDDVPNCFRFGLCPVVIIEGDRLTMLLDIGAEVMILSSDLLHRLFPGQDFPDKGRSIRSLGGNHINQGTCVSAETQTDA